MKKGNRAMEAWLLCFVWMAVIFTMSSMTGEESGEQSGRIVQILLGIFPGIEKAISSLELLVRKGAHMLEFAVLFLLYRRALCFGEKKHAGAMAFGMTMLYAASDELHQMFVAGRGSSVIDVAIDSFGALLAWGAVGLYEKIKKNNKRTFSE